MAYLAHCCSLSYCDKDKISEGLTHNGYEMGEQGFYIANKKTDTQCFIFGDDEKIIITFRGSESQQDWITNFQSTLKNWRGEIRGEVHEGYSVALHSVWAEVEDTVKKLHTGNQSIWVTGHSLGGALATLAAAKLGNKLNGLYTFGQPRVGDRMFSRSYNKILQNRSFRIVNNADLVTRVPFQLFGYSHIGRLKYFDENGKLHSDTRLSWWGRFWDSLDDTVIDIFEGLPDGFSAHDIGIYLKHAVNAAG